METKYLDSGSKIDSEPICLTHRHNVIKLVFMNHKVSEAGTMMLSVIFAAQLMRVTAEASKHDRGFPNCVEWAV